MAMKEIGCHCRSYGTLRDTPSKEPRSCNGINGGGGGGGGGGDKGTNMTRNKNLKVGKTITLLGWTMEDAVDVVRYHPIICVFALSLLFFMAVEYTLFMIPPSSPPFDLGFVITRSFHRYLSDRPSLNTFLAALNTVFVGMQMTYILWTLLVEGRPRATISTLFMFTCRGILGCSTQLPLPEGFLGSGVDFPVGNVSFFLFFSGHVAGSVIASLDMRRMQRRELAWLFDTLNVLQGVRLLGTRGHYTIDLAVGVGAGFLFDSFAGKYEKESKRKRAANRLQGALLK
ncbi:phosphatidylcholine:diacylglycerol cholinephosphotransferase 1-like [Macadamia integrifolia]|uniref:phosphatidylcholine:diacylglycerol cholinephosphotransferase 1-like n=1 Tax=Macadamia integrifolia TaxID=60698 RepID=UPI001C4EB993|nr:phosphatidylcholine:diacylglycerol cholinephosphotransferase 1-like [Macadamia integrifolia]